MRPSRLACFQIVCCALGLAACHRTAEGNYELDLEQTKVCVNQAARDNPEEARMLDETLALLSSTRVDVQLDEVGKLRSTMRLASAGPPTIQQRDGTWRAEGQRVIIKVAGEADTVCEVDEERLRCQKPVPRKLFSNYVLVRK